MKGVARTGPFCGPLADEPTCPSEVGPESCGEAVSLDYAGLTAESVSIVVRVTLDSAKSNGLAWDVGGDMGDPYVVVNGVTKHGGLARCKDSRTCDFYVSASAGSSLGIVVWDEDAGFTGSDDWVGSCTCRVGSRCRCGASSVSVGAIRLP